MIARSWLFCPADRTDRLERATEIADVAIADLEDAVAVTAKEAARHEVVNWLGDNPESARRVWVRVNNDPEHLEADVDAVAGLGIAGIVVPKAESATVSRVADRAQVPVLALVETAASLWRLDQIAQVPGVATLGLGEYDLAADLGAAAPDQDPQPLLWARGAVVAATAAGALAPPPAPVTAVLDDRTAFLDTTKSLQRFGFVGRMCIHPRQVEWAHEAVRPAPREVTWAHEVVAAAEEAERRGSGVAVVSGRMVDIAVVRRARRILELADRDEN